MSRFNLKGMGVALITPFHNDKSIDYDALARLLEYQIKNGVDFLVVLGTTAETATLTAEEKAGIRNYVAQRVAGRVPLVIGIGGNNTMAVVDELRNTDLSAFSAVLSVVPYYNKPSQEGIYRHYEAIANASPLPVILYNVPGRTGVNMTAETTLRLAADFPNIVGIKEASGNFSQIDEIIKRKRDDFMVISGDDGITFPLITLGAVGVISVIGQRFPREFSRMVRPRPRRRLPACSQYPPPLHRTVQPTPLSTAIPPASNACCTPWATSTTNCDCRSCPHASPPTRKYAGCSTPCDHHPPNTPTQEYGQPATRPRHDRLTAAVAADHGHMP